MKNGDTIDILAEWAVWATLDSKTDVELILLKGHLWLELVLDITLERNSDRNYKNYSFYKKVCTLEKIDVQDKETFNIIITALKEVNQLRNKLAHEPHFEIGNGELQSWSANVLENLKGKKFTRHTYRTKIVHSFSVIAINLLKLF
jgi:uncharacterized protein YutE (UPF0331/DUF86 family)